MNINYQMRIFVLRKIVIYVIQKLMVEKWTE